MTGKSMDQTILAFRWAVMGVLAVSMLAGCGPNAFVDSAFVDNTKDPREDLRLSAVDARISSGSVELRRIRGEAASFDQGLGVLRLDRVRVENLSSTGKVEAITEAGSARAYIKDQLVPQVAAPKDAASLKNQTGFAAGQPPGRNDLQFTDGVLHRVPGEAGDTLRLRTAELRWEQASRLFRAPGEFVLESNLPGSARGEGVTTGAGAELVIRGLAFAATGNMEQWNVLGGSMAAGRAGKIPDADEIAAERARLLADFAAVAEPPIHALQQVQPAADPEAEAEGSLLESNTTGSVDSATGSP
jgi:hypothetical protein